MANSEDLKHEDIKTQNYHVYCFRVEIFLYKFKTIYKP